MLTLDFILDIIRGDIESEAAQADLIPLPADLRNLLRAYCRERQRVYIFRLPLYRYLRNRGVNHYKMDLYLHNIFFHDSLSEWESADHRYTLEWKCRNTLDDIYAVSDLTIREKLDALRLPVSQI